MDIIEFEKYAKKKISVNILIWVSLIFSFFLMNQCNGKNDLKEQISTMRKELKNDYQKKISERESIIKSLQKDNKLKKIQIEKMNNKIDSLDKVKSKIQIKYVDRVRGIKIMSSEEIKNYWDGEFN
jgi:uncharacterized protein YlxW (UPF0749 family)